MIRSVAALVAWVSVAGLLAGSAFGQGNDKPPPALAEPDPFEVSEYAKSYEVDQDEAARRLRLQQRSSDIVEALQRKLGGDYAGVWFDNGRGRFKIGVLAGSAREEDARKVAEDRGVGDDTDLENVAYSALDLETAARNIPARIGDLITARKAQPGINDALNPDRALTGVM